MKLKQTLEAYRKELNLVCKKDLPYSLCQIQQRKDNDFPCKWYCFVCKRYVLPDKYHFPVIERYEHIKPTDLIRRDE